jgi:hypothetical protein
LLLRPDGPQTLVADMARQRADLATQERMIARASGPLANRRETAAAILVLASDAVAMVTTHAFGTDGCSRAQEVKSAQKIFLTEINDNPT